MMLPDGIRLLVPATWKVSGARPVSMVPNKGLAEGRLGPVPASVADLLKAGIDPPGALLRAEDTTVAGGRSGVIVGVYETGDSDPIEQVRQAVAEADPGATIIPVSVANGAGLRADRPADGETEQVVRDYWGRVRNLPTSLTLIRFWHEGAPAGPDELAVFDDIAGSCQFMYPNWWSGPAASTTRTNYQPPSSDEGPTEGLWRYAGWRLGSAFHSKMVAQKDVAILTEMGFRPRDGLLLLAVYLVWVSLALALIGFETGILLVGSIAAFGTLTLLRTQRLRALVALAVILAVLLGIGLVA
jgi:hypothetical protein